MKYLIVSADDLGLSDSINRGIIRSFEEGIVTNLNVIPTGKAFYDAMALLKILKPQEISAHLALTETAPVTDSRGIPTLLDGKGGFDKSYPMFTAKFFLGKIDRGQIYIELKNQIERLRGFGFPITGLSGHQHIHTLPGILDIFIRLAREYKIPSIRCLYGDRFSFPFGVKKIFKKAILGYFGSRMKKALDRSSIRRADNFLGFLDSGNIREEILIKMLNSLPEGTTELVTHPGFISSEVLDRCVFHSNCETDLAALISSRVKKTIADNGIKLISFGDLVRLPKS